MRTFGQLAGFMLYCAAGTACSAGKRFQAIRSKDLIYLKAQLAEARLLLSRSARQHVAHARVWKPADDGQFSGNRVSPGQSTAKDT
jgi:hypothetical protein